jgi:capsular exopolysaccharide synthesis family protein
MPSSNNSQHKIIALTNQKSPISESYIKLRTNIQLSAIDEPIQVIMCTSSNPGEGKSTTAVNLGAVFAQADQRVLIVDADLRKPTMHRFFMTSNRIGLTSVLTGQVELEDAVHRTEENYLHVLPSGPIPPNPSELLSSKRMERLLTELRGKYDIIIIDTPPILAVADAQIMSTLCDGVVLVLASGQVKRELAVKSKEALVIAKARILGVVLNKMDRKNAESYYYYYYGERAT